MRNKRTPGPTAILTALSRISNAELSEEHLQPYFREISEMANPRGAAILLAAHVESGLQLALAARLRIKQSSWPDIFSSERGPMGTFSNKTRVAHAIGLITDATRQNLDLIRGIRNAFAHAMRPISFDTPEVLNACAALQPPVALPPATGTHADAAHPTSRQRYQQTCELILHNLFVAAGFYFEVNRLPPPDSV